MSYARWSHSHWYAYWSTYWSDEYGEPSIEFCAADETTQDPPGVGSDIVFRLSQIRTDHGACLARLRELNASASDADLAEAGEILNRFVKDAG